MESILTSIKKLLGITSDYTHFDADLIIHINSVLSILYQMGVGSGEQPFQITSDDETWNDYLEGDARLSDIKTYIYLKVRKIFDPTVSNAVSGAADSLIDELEWRINATADYEIKE